MPAVPSSSRGDVVEPDRPLGDVDPALQARVHGDEVVFPVDLEAVAGVVEERDVGGPGGLEEVADHRGHLGLGQVRAADHLEAERVERVGDVGGVVDRVLQRVEVGVGAVADHQRDAGLGAGGGGQREHERAEGGGEAGRPAGSGRA